MAVNEIKKKRDSKARMSTGLSGTVGDSPDKARESLGEEPEGARPDASTLTT